MDINQQRKRLKRQLDSVIIHFDYDCFYASVFEAETPALRSLPLAVQQKQIVVTCNYEARRRGLHKLQLIKEAKRICPDVVIVLGEDLTRFRNASKELYAFLRGFSWNSKVERLGFDEVFMDVSDIVEYNLGLLNSNDLTKSFFCLSKSDPTIGFEFDASQLTGYTYPDASNDKLCVDPSKLDTLPLRLHLGSHLAQFLRHQLNSEKGYTCTVGVSTNKLLSKLVGNLHKPNGQTTLLPPYTSDTEEIDNVTSFIDGHEIGKIPGVGFKLAYKIRAHVLQKSPEFDMGLVYGGTKENVRVANVRGYPGMSAETLQEILGGPSIPHDVGIKIWGLLNGCDDTEVGQAREVPKSISIEDSYMRLDTLDEVLKELHMLAKSLLKRIHTDLLEEDEDQELANSKDVSKHSTATDNPAAVRKRWLAYPKTLRLSTRPRPPQNPDGSRNRSFARISRSAQMPNFIFSLKESIDALADRLVTEALVPLFRKIHPEKSGWNLSLVNVAATNMADAASHNKSGAGRDISKMFKRQDDVLKQFRIEEEDLSAEGREKERMNGNIEQEVESRHNGNKGSEDVPTRSQGSNTEGNGAWESDEEGSMNEAFQCDQCGAVMPIFALAAHDRWHSK
ncbi:DNA/RNA polymerase, partial [Zopfia rhizophila CBS 207.26]